MKPILNTKTHIGSQQNDREKMHPSKLSQADIPTKQCLLNKTKISWFPPWVIRSCHRDPSSLHGSHSQGWGCQMVTTVGYHLRWNYSLWRLSSWLTDFPHLYPYRLYHTPISHTSLPTSAWDLLFPRNVVVVAWLLGVTVYFLLHQKLIENRNTLFQFHSA